MSWNITLNVNHDGEVTVTSKSGDLPNGAVLLYGHHTPNGTGFGMNVEGASSSAFVPFPKAIKETK